MKALNPLFCIGSCARICAGYWFRTLLLAFVFFPLSLLGQDGETGNVEGRVFNRLTGNYVNRALVLVEGTSIRVYTNEFGEYTIRNAPAGLQQVKVQYTGMAEEAQYVEILSGVSVQQDLTLRNRRGGERGDDVIELEAFEVSARDSFQSFADIAVHEERYSANLRNVVSADAYGTIAQGNVGEFIKFLPGVAVDYGGTYSSGADATEISIRGFRPDQTTITVDGVPISSAQPGSLTRGVSLDMLSINNASRVEVIKVPTPDQHSVGIGGSVNLISKTAFEYPKPTFKFRAYLSMNSEHLDFFQKTPGPMHDTSHKIQPNIEMSYAWPINDKIGLTFNYAKMNQFNSNTKYNADWEYYRKVQVEGFPDGIPRIVTTDGELLLNAFPDMTRPVLNNISLTDSPRISERESGSIKLDYAPFSGHLITANYSYSTFSAQDAGRRLEVGTGGVGNVFEYGPDYAISRDGTGKAEINLTALDREGETHSGYLKWSYKKGPWDIVALGSASVSDGEMVSSRNGHFSGMDLQMGGIHKAIVRDLVDGVPGSVEYYDEFGNSMDPTVLSSYRVSGYDPADLSASRLKVLAGESFTRSENYAGKLDVRRELDFLPFEFMNLAVKAGVYWQERKEEKQGRGTGYGYQYIGESGVELNMDDFRDDYYLGVSPGFGFAPREWPDSGKLYDYFSTRPDVFSDTNDMPVFDSSGTLTDESVASANWGSYVNQQKSITETTISQYVQLESDFFSNRLTIVGGVRREESKRVGRSPYTNNRGLQFRVPVDENGDGIMDSFKTPDGAFISATDWITVANASLLEAGGAVYPDGSPFRRSELDTFTVGTGSRAQTYYGTVYNGQNFGPVLPGTLEHKQATLIPNYEINEKSKGRASPMISGSFDVTEKLVFRAAWSETYAPPSYEGTYGVLQTVQITPANDGSNGTIKVGNPALRPWTSSNWDFGISYYTDSGGKFSVNYFTKSITDMHQNLLITPNSTAYNYNEEMIKLGYGPGSVYYRDQWDIQTVINVPDGGEQYGYEFDFQQDLSILGGIGRYFYVFASYSTKRRTVSETVENADQQFGNNAPDNYAAGGINFNYKRLNIRVNATWRNENILSRGTMTRLHDPYTARIEADPNTGREANYDSVSIQRYRPAEWKVDLSMAYRLNDNLVIDFAARNITDTGRESFVRSVDGSIPEYALMGERSTYGINFTIGLSGEF